MIELEISKENRSRKEEDKESHNTNRNGAKALNMDIMFDEKKQPGDGIDDISLLFLLKSPLQTKMMSTNQNLPQLCHSHSACYVHQAMKITTSHNLKLNCMVLTEMSSHQHQCWKGLMEKWLLQMQIVCFFLCIQWLRPKIYH